MSNAHRVNPVVSPIKELARLKGPRNGSRKRMKRSTKRFLKSLPAIIGCLLLLPFYAFYLMFTELIASHRMKRDAKVSRCRNCDAVLGKRSLELADEHWREHVRKLRDQYPGSRLRLVRVIQAICEQCGTMHHYARSTREFVVPTPRQSRHPTHYDNGEPSVATEDAS